ncbi:hypothetical protein KIPB_007134 [Kipferlia bialata]|uniref:Uncharacterized protein n=1 Tax=Kipferlia bialata TaxID=797122 RepID=A0A9K3CY43_9EUKA|nr:hypothetical protein KIPB_007134 [Kipferlia bialata]|eukprot:g7134.t1
MEAKALAAFHRYLEVFNKEDLEGVKALVHPDVKVYFEGTLVKNNFEELLPEYTSDFGVHKRVEISRAPVVSVKGDYTAVNVNLTARVPPTEVISLDFDYVYNKDMVMVKQVITNVNYISK